MASALFQGMTIALALTPTLKMFVNLEKTLTEFAFSSDDAGVANSLKMKEPSSDCIGISLARPAEQTC